MSLNISIMDFNDDDKDFFYGLKDTDGTCLTIPKGALDKIAGQENPLEYLKAQPTDKVEYWVDFSEVGDEFHRVETDSKSPVDKTVWYVYVRFVDGDVVFTGSNEHERLNDKVAIKVSEADFLKMLADSKEL